jgi:hypothetical protein
MPEVVHRIRVVSGLVRFEIPGLITGSTLIHDRMLQGVSIFTAPNPSLPILAGQISDLTVAQQATKNNKSAIPNRDLKRDIVWTSIQSEVAMVQGLCNQSPEQAAMIAAAAGMGISPHITAPKPVIEATLTLTPGTVLVVANASMVLGASLKTTRNRTWLWRHTLDGGKTFVNDDPTAVARTQITGLPLNTEIGFQVAAKDSKGLGIWTQPYALFVH